MNRSQKNDLIESVREKCNNYSTVIVSHYAGLTVSDISQLRCQLRDHDIYIKVIKNKLAKIAVKTTSKEALTSILEGPVILAFSHNPVDITKILSDFANNNSKLLIKGGVLDDKYLSKEDVIALSKLPSIDQLRGKIISVIQAPAQKMAKILSAPAFQIACVTQQYSSKSH